MFIATRAAGNWSRGVVFSHDFRVNEPQGPGKLDMASCTAGTSKTIWASEVVIGHPHLNRNSDYRAGNAWGNVTPTDNGCGSGGAASNGRRQTGSSWFEGYMAQHIAFTSLMTPNAKLFDCSMNSNDMAYGSRSKHPGLVQCVAVDGSVHAVTDDIDWATWRNLGCKDDGFPASFK